MNADRLYLAHIRDALMRIADYTLAGEDAFLADSRTQDAVIRNLEVIGEAAKRISEQTKGDAPAIPWRVVAGMRDKLIHHYFGVDVGIVWAVVVHDLPAMRREIDRLLDDAAG